MRGPSRTFHLPSPSVPDPMRSLRCAAPDGIPDCTGIKTLHRDSPRDGSANSNVDGRSPGSRVVARGHLPGFPAVSRPRTRRLQLRGQPRPGADARTAFPKSLLSENRHLLDTGQAKARQSESDPMDVPSPCPALPQLTLVLGGARSGKSRHAEGLVTATPSPWIYIATAQAFDAEMTA